MKYVVMVFALFSFGCTAPMKYTSKPLEPYDRDTEYTIEQMNDGFAITVLYSKYQFVPESDAIALSCKQAITTIAYEYADKNGRKIEPINEQRIKLSTGRNGLSGVTSCSANAVVEWKR